MKLENYISDLLYRYDCVIVPNFGGFVANKKSATVNQHTFSPPYKQITFNSLLIENDGLLANYIAQVDKMPYATAINFIDFEVQEWIEKLLNEQLDLEGIGTLFNVNDTIEFEPENKMNYLTDSFGLKSVVSHKIIPKNESINITERIASLQTNTFVPNKEVTPLNPPIILERKTSKRKTFVKYAAIFMLSATSIALMAKKISNNTVKKQQFADSNKQQKIRDAKIQTATFVIENPLPIIELTANKSIAKNYHIIAGAFRSKENANTKVNQLTNLGFNASIVGKNKFELYQVAFESFADLENANTKLSEIKSNVLKDAWMLVKE